MATDPTEGEDAEIAAIAAVGAALTKLTDEHARRRVISYFVGRYIKGASVEVPVAVTSVEAYPPTVQASATSVPAVPGGAVVPREIPGIARITDTGELKITARDLKAKTALDAAIRLSHIAIWAHERLTGQPLSSRKALTPLLKEWRLYSGNTRAWLARNRGVIRSGDSLMLDAHARRDAERFAQDVLDDDIAGTWRPR